MYKKIIISSLLAVGLSVASAQTKSLEERVAELEANQSLNIFKFSGTLATTYDHIEGKQTKGMTYDDKTDFLRLLSYLNFDANVSDSIKFYSRFTASKFFNNVSNQSGTMLNIRATDLGVARSYSGSQVYLEKAYADVRIANSNLTFSFGRLSTMEGPPMHLPNGKARMGTYPSLAYNVLLDGFALTHSNDIGNNNFAARLVFSPLVTVVQNYSTMPNYQTRPTSDLNGSTGNKFSNMEAKVLSLMLEYNMKDIGFANNLSLIYQGISVGNLLTNGATLPAIPASVYPPGFAAGTGSTSSEYTAHNLTAELSDIASSGFDLNVSAQMSEMKNKGVITYLPLGGPVYGFGATKEDETLSSTTTLVSLRYKFMSTNYLGVESLNGGKNNFIYDMGAEDLTNFQATPGTGTHVYFLHKFTPELGLRIGSRTQEYKYSALTVGPTSEIDRKVSSYYAQLRLDF